MSERLIHILVCEKEYNNTETEIVAAFDRNNMSEEEFKNGIFDALNSFEDGFLPTIYEETELKEEAENIAKGMKFFDGDEVFKLKETTLYM